MKILRFFACLCLLVYPSLEAFSYVDRLELHDFGKMETSPFFDLKGNRKTIKNYRGKYVLLTFWATWCRACVSEMPSLEKLARQFKHDDLVIAAISRNYPTNMGPSVEQFRLKAGLLNVDFWTDIDGRELHKAYDIRGLPTTLLIDRGGRIIGRVEGVMPWDHKDFIRFFQDVLEDKIKPESKESFWQKFGKVFK